MKHERIYKVRKLESGKYALEFTQDNVTKVEDFFRYETLEEAQKECDQLNERVYISYFDASEITEFYNSIDFTPLYNEIMKTTGLYLTFTNELIKTGNGYRVKIESNENLADKFQIIKAAWKDFRVSTFNSQICVNQETRGLKYWCDIQYSYEHQSGGTNGAEILSAHYTPEKGWQIW